ncbi:hypothetical protein GOBAR_DD20949 [Gossypium barbadense]|nr:hypothetical protein GOBAR_DD20949 [Gossypium barbadense]
MLVEKLRGFNVKGMGFFYLQLVMSKVTAMLSLAAACSSAGIIVLYARDLDFCKAQSHILCRQFEISIILAFITWLLIAMSSHLMFWILASF